MTGPDGGQIPKRPPMRIKKATHVGKKIPYKKIDVVKGPQIEKKKKTSAHACPPPPAPHENDLYLYLYYIKQH